MRSAAQEKIVKIIQRFGFFVCYSESTDWPIALLEYSWIFIEGI